MDNGASSYRRFLEGEKEAFDEIIDAYFDGLTFFLNRYVQNFAVAEDIAIDVFTELVVHPKRYNFSVSLKTYLYMLGRSRALNYLKKQKRHIMLDIEETAEWLADEKDLESQIIADERKALVNEGLKQLPTDMRIVATSLVLLLCFAMFDNNSIPFGNKVMNVIALDLEEGRSFYAAEMEQVEELLERLDSYTEVALLDKGQYDKEDASYYFLFEDINGAEKNYYLYEDGTLVCGDGKTYHLDEEQLQALTGNVEENFYWNQQESIGQYERLMNSYYKNKFDSSNFGGAYIDDNGELVVLLVDINEESIREIQEVIYSKSLIIKDCECTYTEMMNVIDAFNSRLHLPGYQELEIVSIYEDVYDNQVHIKVRKLTPEKEEAIRNIVDSPCMVISDSASKVIESPLAEEDINQIPGANMSIVENSVTPTSLTVVFSYTGKGKMKYGPENYLIERYDKDEKKWYRITDYREAITLVEQVVCAGEYVEETYDWEWAYDVLPEGHYRILIDCSYYVDDEEQGSTYLVEEFYVE